MKTLQLLLLLIITSLFISTVCAQSNNTNNEQTIYTTPLNGIYIIGSSSFANYSNITNAIADLTQNGVSGPVDLFLEMGTYSGCFNITNIPGSSITNTITFQSLNGDTATTTIGNSISANSYVFKLDSAHNINFKNLGFRTDGVSESKILNIINSNHISIDNCHFIGTNCCTNIINAHLIRSIASDYIYITNSTFYSGNTPIYILLLYTSVLNI